MPNLFYYILFIGVITFLWVMYVCISRLNYLINKSVSNSKFAVNNDHTNSEMFNKLIAEYQVLMSEFEILKEKEKENEHILQTMMISSIVDKYKRISHLKNENQTLVWYGETGCINDTPSIKYDPFSNKNINSQFYSEMLKN